MGTARDLHITYWLKEKSDPPFTIAVPGLKITGWWPKEAPGPDALGAINEIWAPASCTIEIEKDILEDADGKKHQFCAYVRVKEYPATGWPQIVAESLGLFIQRGACIAWAGGFECFLHYSLDEELRGCYAACTATTGLICFSINPDDRIICIDETPGTVAQLHAAVLDCIHRTSHSYGTSGKCNGAV